MYSLLWIFIGMEYFSSSSDLYRWMVVFATYMVFLSTRNDTCDFYVDDILHMVRKMDQTETWIHYYLSIYIFPPAVFETPTLERKTLYLFPPAVFETPTLEKKNPIHHYLFPSRRL
jgi:hypothetical protein